MSVLGTGETSAGELELAGLNGAQSYFYWAQLDTLVRFSKVSTISQSQIHAKGHKSSTLDVIYDNHGFELVTLK